MKQETEGQVVHPVPAAADQENRDPESEGEEVDEGEDDKGPHDHKCQRCDYSTNSVEYFTGIFVFLRSVFLYNWFCP